MPVALPKEVYGEMPAAARTECCKVKTSGSQMKLRLTAIDSIASGRAPAKVHRDRDTAVPHGLNVTAHVVPCATSHIQLATSLPLRLRHEHGLVHTAATIGPAQTCDLSGGSLVAVAGSAAPSSAFEPV